MAFSIIYSGIVWSIRARIVQVVVDRDNDNLASRTPKNPPFLSPWAARGGVIGDAKSRRLFSVDAVSPSAVSRGPTRRYWRSNLGSRASITELRAQRRRCRPGKMAVLIELRLQRETVPRPTLANRRPDSPNWLLARILVIEGVGWLAGRLRICPQRLRRRHSRDFSKTFSFFEI